LFNQVTAQRIGSTQQPEFFFLKKTTDWSECSDGIRALPFFFNKKNEDNHQRS